jgi:hypothetical protein
MTVVLSLGHKLKTNAGVRLLIRSPVQDIHARYFHPYASSLSYSRSPQISDSANATIRGDVI